MSNRNLEERAASRAEARRRARLAARGEPIEADDEDEVVDEPERGSGPLAFVRRIFPTAPPLPGRPDPLAGFSHEGPLRPILERVYLLSRNPLAWVLPGALWFGARILDPSSALGLVASLVSFAGLIAAGWFGWQRPALYGTAAALLGFFVFVAWVFWFFANLGAAPTEVGSAGSIIVGVTFQAVLQAALGFVSGWYGGYLRRRNAQVNQDLARRRR